MSLPIMIQETDNFLKEMRESRPKMDEVVVTEMEQIEDDNDPNLETEEKETTEEQKESDGTFGDTGAGEEGPKQQPGE